MLLLPSILLECVLEFLSLRDDRDQAVCKLRGVSCVWQLQLRIADLSGYAAKVARWRTQSMTRALAAHPLPCVPLSMMHCEGAAVVWHIFRDQALADGSPRLFDLAVLLDLIAQLEDGLAALAVAVQT